MVSQARQVGAAGIVRSLAIVEAERARRAADPVLGAAAQAIKRYQQARFRHSHADLLASERYGLAARFFLDELYGPADFSQRDAEFGRIVPALARLFPGELVETVESLAALHALSEELDSAMAVALASPAVDAETYTRTWRTVGRTSDRDRQIELVVDVGRALDRYTRLPALTMSLRMMRRPARLAGLSELQAFLERGFDTFKAMRGAQEFLETIQERERTMAARLFAGEASGQLP